jgi:hypothetical protein
MSVFRERSVTCPGCGTATERSVAISVNGERSAQHRAEILAGTFQVFECPSCHQAAQADGPLLYVELAARRWIGCFPRAWETSWRHLENEPLDNWRRTMIDHAPASVRKMSDGFVVRAVFGLPALREKILCLDHGCDDRLLEVLKLDLMRTSGELLVHPDARPLLIDASDDALLFVAGKPAGQSALEFGIGARWVDDVRFSVPRSRLVQIGHESSRWADALRRLSGGPYVDLGRIMLEGTAELPPGAELIE